MARTAIDPEHVRQFFAERGCTLLEPYTRSTVKMRYVCACKTVRTSTWGVFKKSDGRCRFCREGRPVREYRRDKDMLLVRSVDAVRDLIRSGRLDPTSTSFTKIADIPIERLQRSQPERSWQALHTWLTNRMRHAWHPEAKSYVYAYAYRPRAGATEEEQDRYDAAMLERSTGRHGETWLEDRALVKVGTSTDPEHRRHQHLYELLGKGNEIGPMMFNCRILILPVRGANAADYLESLVLDSLPKEDAFHGEWFHDTVGVARTLAGWFCAARVCYREPPAATA